MTDTTMVNRISQKEEEKEKLRHTVESSGWKEIVEPWLRRELNSAKSEVKSAATKKTLDEITASYLQGAAAENVLTNLFRMINQTLGTRENNNG